MFSQGTVTILWAHMLGGFWAVTLRGAKIFVPLPLKKYRGPPPAAPPPPPVVNDRFLNLPLILANIPCVRSPSCVLLLKVDVKPA